MAEQDLYHRHLISMSDLSSADIAQIIETAKVMKGISERDIKKAPTLRGRTVINFFAEPSTRTRTSFEIAGKRLSADVINVSASGSSLSKGESIKDMVHTLDAMKPDMLVMRSGFAGVPRMMTEWIECPVVNAGDGRHEHPSQCLLDLMTIQEKKERLEGLKVSIIGDILNSRVAKSNMIAMRKIGMRVTVCGPATLLPVNIEQIADHVTSSLDEAIDGADVIMALRVQTERLERIGFPNVREYSKYFGLNLNRMKKAKKDALVLHPGPINQGVEISPEVAEGPWSVILEQVTNGVAVRMAILYLLLGGGLQINE
jgi:aspartate carbamoyltransferase catalytic subunit